MIGPSITPSKTKGKQPIVSSDEFDTEPEGVYQYTRTRTSVIAPVDYSALVFRRERFCIVEYNLHTKYIQ